MVKVSITDLCSGIGGCLGLWIGFSAITFIEICMFFAKLAATLSKGKSAIFGNEKSKVKQIHVESSDKIKEAIAGLKDSKMAPVIGTSDVQIKR